MWKILRRELTGENLMIAFFKPVENYLFALLHHPILSSRQYKSTESLWAIIQYCHISIFTRERFALSHYPFNFLLIYMLWRHLGGGKVGICLCLILKSWTRYCRSAVGEKHSIYFYNFEYYHLISYISYYIWSVHYT